MNIREHIEAGHYDRDDKGRALVPTDWGCTATITATDKPGVYPLVGWTLQSAKAPPDWTVEIAWGADGIRGNGPNLLPPPPRKVKVTRYVVVHRNYVDPNAFATHQEANDWAGKNYSRPLGARIVELTGEYEEPWS